MAEAYATQTNFNAPANIPPAISAEMVGALITMYGIKGAKPK